MDTFVLPDIGSAPLDRLDGTRLLRVSEAPIATVRNGLRAETLDRLTAFLGCSAASLASVLGIAPRTLARRRKAGILSPEESDRLLRIARLAELALAVFEDAEAAADWLTSPKRLLGGETPLEHADTAPGIREVEDMLFAVEFSGAA